MTFSNNKFALRQDAVTCRKKCRGYVQVTSERSSSQLFLITRNQKTTVTLNPKQQDRFVYFVGGEVLAGRAKCWEDRVKASFIPTTHLVFTWALSHEILYLWEQRKSADKDIFKLVIRKLQQKWTGIELLGQMCQNFFRKKTHQRRDVKILGIW